MRIYNLRCEDTHNALFKNKKSLPSVSYSSDVMFLINYYVYNLYCNCWYNYFKVFTLTLAWTDLNPHLLPSFDKKKCFQSHFKPKPCIWSWYLTFLKGRNSISDNLAYMYICTLWKCIKILYLRTIRSLEYIRVKLWTPIVTPPRAAVSTIYFSISIRKLRQ